MHTNVHQSRRDAELKKVKVTVEDDDILATHRVPGKKRVLNR